MGSNLLCKLKFFKCKPNVIYLGVRYGTLKRPEFDFGSYLDDILHLRTKREKENFYIQKRFILQLLNTHTIHLNWGVDLLILDKV